MSLGGFGIPLIAPPVVALSALTVGLRKPELPAAQARHKRERLAKKLAGKKR